MVENLTPGSTYKFKVTARNAVGSGAESVPAEILAAQVPDAPLNLANAPEVTSATQVGLTWAPGAFDGASALLDYQVSYKEESSSDYIVYSTGVTSTQETVTGLNQGVTYNFVVQARNEVGLSA